MTQLARGRLVPGPGEPSMTAASRQSHLLGLGAAGGHYPQHGMTQPQHADLRIKGLGVHGGHLRQVHLAGQDPLDGGQVKANLTQGPDQLQAGQRPDVITAVPGGSPLPGRHISIPSGKRQGRIMLPADSDRSRG
jgi:hypothetical protein